MNCAFYYLDNQKEPDMIRYGHFTRYFSSMIMSATDPGIVKIKLLASGPSSNKSLESPYRFRPT